MTATAPAEPGAPNDPPSGPHVPQLPPKVRSRVAAFDDRVDTALDRLRGHPVADRLFYGASRAGDHSMIWVALAILRVLRGGHHRRAGLRVLLAMPVESAVVNLGIKSLFRRSRPVWEADKTRPHYLRKPRTSSFPSGHATAGFTAASLLSDGDPVLRPFYYATAAVVASSRVYVKIHHASDVIVGAGVGAVLGRIARRISPLPPKL